MDRVRVAVIGAGNIAREHLRVLSELDDIEVVGIAGTGGPRAEQLATEFAIPHVSSDHTAMLDSIEVDAVLVAVSVMAVHEVAAGCLDRGLPALIEKPPGLTSTEAWDLHRRANGVLNMVGLNRRFYSTVARAAEAIEESGPLVSMLVEAPERIEYVRSLHIHPDEVLARWTMANGVHCIDLLRLFGGEVGQVFAAATAWGADGNNTFGALLRFASGATGHYVSNWTAPGGWSVTLYGVDRKVTLGPLESGTIEDRGREPRAIPVDAADTRFKPGLYAQDKHFIDCLRSGRPIGPPAADLAEAARTMELVETISNGTGI